jgi:hypothetical protein
MHKRVSVIMGVIEESKRGRWNTEWLCADIKKK